MKTQLKDLEPTIKEGLANHFRGVINVAGRLWLTDRRLIFKSHALNLGGHEESYPLTDIVEIRLRNTLFIVPNGLSIVLKDGREERFVVYGRKDWAAKIVEAVNKTSHQKR